MKLRSLGLGIAVLAALSASIALEVIYVSELVNRIAWGITALLFAAWIVLNRGMLASFLTKKSTRYGANLSFVIFLLLGILVFLNVIAKEHPWKKDLTRSGANTLSEQSRKIVRELPQEVKATFFTSLNERDKGEELLGRYRYQSKRFQYEFVDVDRSPTRAEAMGVKRKGAIVLTLEGTNKKVMLDAATEEQVTNGLIKLLRSREVAIYFLNGHEEHPIEGEQNPLGFSSLQAELSKQGYLVKDLNLVSAGKVPDDAAVLVIGGPKRAFFPKEVEIISSWIKAGGHALLAVDLDVGLGGLAKGSQDLARLVAGYGVQIKSELLVDPRSKAADVEPQVILGFSGSKEHPITRDFPKSIAVANFLFPLTTYLEVGQPKDFAITPLAATSNTAWAESDWGSVRSGQVNFNAGADRKGPMNLAVAVEAVKVMEGAKPEEAKSKGTRLVVFANALFATNNLFDKVGNRDLMLNSIAWLADDDRFISIRASEDQDSIKPFNSVAVNLIFLFTAFVVPLLVVIAGVVVWWRRKKL